MIKNHYFLIRQKNNRILFYTNTNKIIDKNYLQGNKYLIIYKINQKVLKSKHLQKRIETCKH